MSDTQETKPQETKPQDLTKIAAGTFAPDLFGGAPSDAVKQAVLRRVGFGNDAPESAGIAPVHLADTNPDLERVPSPFPPADYRGPLMSVADWLACVDACKSIPPKPETQDAGQDRVVIREPVVTQDAVIVHDPELRSDASDDVSDELPA